MAEIGASCSSGCAVMNGSIRDRLVPVKRPKRGTDGTGQELSFHILAVRLSFFTLRGCVIGSFPFDAISLSSKVPRATDPGFWQAGPK